MASVVFDSSITPDLIKRMTSAVNDQTLVNIPAIQEGWIPYFDKKQVQGRVTIAARGTTTTGIIADGGTTAYGSQAPVVGKYDGQVFYSGVRIGQQAADMTEDIEDGVDLMRDSFEGMKEDIERLTARAMLGASLGTVALATTANVSTTTTMLSGGILELQQAIDIYNGTTLVETVVISDLAPGTAPADAWTITFTGDGTGGACANSWTTSYTIYLHGTGPSGSTNASYTPVGLDDVIANASLYAVGTTTKGWKAALDSTAEALSREKLDNLAVKRFQLAKNQFDYILCNSLNELRMARLEEEQIRYADPAKGLDRRGEGRLMFRGKPVVVDETCKNTHLYMGKKGSFKIHRFQKFEPNMTGTGLKRPGFRQAEGTHDLIMKFSAYMNGRCERRRDYAGMTAISG